MLVCISPCGREGDALWCFRGLESWARAFSSLAQVSWADSIEAYLSLMVSVSKVGSEGD